MRKVLGGLGVAIVSLIGFASTASADVTVCYDYSVNVNGQGGAAAECQVVDLP